MTRLRIVLIAAVVITAALTIGPETSAAPTCTITLNAAPAIAPWNQASSWTDAANGQARVPVATDHVCITAGRSVQHSTGTDSVLSIQDSGQLVVSGGTLTLSSTVAAESSNATDITINGGTLSVAGRLDLHGTSN